MVMQAVLSGFMQKCEPALCRQKATAPTESFSGFGRYAAGFKTQAVHITIATLTSKQAFRRARWEARQRGHLVVETFDGDY